MVAQSIVYGLRQTVACTLASLANSSNRQSVVVNNSTTLAVDYTVSVQITTGTSPTLNNVIIVYMYTYDGAIYAGGCNGTDAAYTAAQELDLYPAATLLVSASSNVAYTAVIPSIAALFGGTLPVGFGFVIENTSGVALNSTAGNHILAVTPINYAYA